MSRHRNRGWSKVNTYKKQDEFSKSFIRRLHRMQDMNTENDREFTYDCISYGEWVSDNCDCGY